ncbi:MAG: hypothetical protein ACYTHK_00810 [Planctomycetota bacterium]|jgi:hypothetical protein
MKRSILLLAGLLFWLPACGGGGGGGGLPSGTLPVTANTAQALAQLVVGGLDTTVDTNLGIEAIFERFEPGEDGRYPCPDGGFFDLTSNSNSATLVFDNCMIDIGNGVETFDGQMSIELVDSNTFKVTLDLTITTDGQSTKIAGDMRLAYTDLGGTTERLVLTGNRLSLTADGETLSLEKYRYEEVLDWMTGDYSFDERGTIRSSTTGGTIYFRTLESMIGQGDEYPVSGVIEIRGLGGSTMTMTVVGNDIFVEIDEDGDGKIDEQYQTSWDQLD